MLPSWQNALPGRFFTGCGMCSAAFGGGLGTAGDTNDKEARKYGRHQLQRKNGSAQLIGGASASGWPPCARRAILSITRQLPQIVIGVCGGDGIGPRHYPRGRARAALSSERRCGAGRQGGVQGDRRPHHREPRSPQQSHPRRRAGRTEGMPRHLERAPPPPPAQATNGPTSKAPTWPCAKSWILFANVRPVKVPEQGIDWTFFRENTEGAYTLGSCGLRRRRTASRWTSPSPPLRARERIAALGLRLRPQKPQRAGCPSLPKPTSSRPPTASF